MKERDLIKLIYILCIFFIAVLAMAMVVSLSLEVKDLKERLIKVEYRTGVKK